MRRADQGEGQVFARDPEVYYNARCVTDSIKTIAMYARNQCLIE
ncbi:hypothetical protein RSAG8_00184, partial [Rhizoctonia solani AG-8 WAC10335]